MSDDSVHRQTYNITDLSARTVTIYPTRAAIVRDLENVDIRPGRTEITINNLTPLADEHTIQVSGHGTRAVVTDMTVDLVANRTIGELDVSDSDDSDSEDEDSLRPAELVVALEQVEKLEDDREGLVLTQASVNARQGYLENSMKHNAATQKGLPDLGGYKQVREELVKELRSVTKALAENTSDLEKARKRLAKLQRAFDRSRKVPREAKRQRRLAREDRRREKKEQKLENPANVYRVRITVEDGGLPEETKAVVGKITTGMPSRAEDDVDESRRKGAYLRISYITTGAWWTPQYDLRLDSTNQSGTLTYRAGFCNRTGETWRDAKITLSTSSNTFSGLEDKVPWMAAWNVGLAGRYGGGVDGGLYSPAERQEREKKKLRSAPAPPPPQAAARSWAASSYAAEGAAQDSSYAQPLAAATVARKAARRSMVNRTSFGSLAGRGDGGNRFLGEVPSEDEEEPDEDDALTLASVAASFSDTARRLLVATANAESHGMTTTYDLPGTRTINSSKLTRRHVITELQLPSVAFSHISVPKLRAAVFLKARIFNKSSISLLPGKAGLTLDGSFLGNSNIPLCVPNNHFDVGLGVDEAIQIHYAKPVKKLSSHGMMMMKGHIISYARSIKIHNVRKGPVKLLVLDQIPVSDDDQLRIGIVNPKGLGAEGDSVVLPVQGGKGKVSLKKGGELWFELDMRDGGDVVLPLEYEARLPHGEGIRAK